MLFLLSLNSLGQTTRYWVGGANASYVAAASWSSIGLGGAGDGAPVADDILIIDGSDISSVGGLQTGSVTITNVPTQAIRRLTLQNGADATMTSAASNTLTLGIGSGLPALRGGLEIFTGSILNSGSNVNVTADPGAPSQIDGTLQIGSGSTFTTTGGGGQPTTVTGIINNAGTVTSSTAKLIFNSGSTYNHSRNGGTVASATWNAGSTCLISGITNSAPTGLNQAFSNFTWNSTGQSSAITLVVTGDIFSINGNLTITSTNGNNLFLADPGSFTLNLGGNLIINGPNAILDFCVSGGATSQTYNITGNLDISNGIFYMGTTDRPYVLNLTGDFIMTGGTLSETGVATYTSNFNFVRTGTQVFNKTGGVISGLIDFNVSGTTNLDINTSVLTGDGDFTLNSGGTLTTANASGISASGATGSIQVNGTRNFNTGAKYVYNSSIGDQITGSGLPPTVNSLSVSNTSGTGIVTLTNSTTVSSVFGLWSGILSIGSNNIILASGAGLDGVAPSSTNMVATGSGQFIKYFAVGNTPAFTFPVGELTGTTEYTPLTIDFSANATAGNIGVSVTDAIHPSINTGGSPSDYLSRYWSLSAPTLSTYTYSASTYSYTAGDINGTEAAIKLSYWNGSAWTEIAGSSSAGNSLSITAPLTESTGPLNGNDFTGRFLAVPPLYYRSQASADWNLTTTWETSVDGISWPGTAALVTPTDVNSSGIIIRAGDNVTVTADVSADDLTLDGTITVNSGQTLTISNGAAATDMLVSTAGIVNNSGTLTATGSIAFTGNSSYNHLRDGGVIPIAVWSATSTCTIGAGFAGTTPGGLSQTFGNFGMNVPQTLTLSSNLIVTNGLNLTSGFISLAANDLIYSGTEANIAGESSSSYIVTGGTGGFIRNIDATGTYIFPLGDAGNYSPISYNFTAGTFASATLKGQVSPVKHPNNTSITDFINRYWRMTPSGTFTAPTYTATFTFVPGDVDGSASNMLGGLWDGAAWTNGNLPTGNNFSMTSSLIGTPAVPIDFTGISGVPPTVVTYSPPDESVTAGISDNLVLVFSEDVMMGTGGSITIYNSDATLFEDIPYNDPRISFSSATVTVNPSGTFTGNSSYYIQISNTAIRDLAGVFYTGISNNTTWNFTATLPLFRSKSAGPSGWNNTATWEVSNDNIIWVDATQTPTDINSKSIVVRAGHTVNISADVQADDLTVDGTITINSGQTLTVANGVAATDMTVSTTGVINNQGSVSPAGSITFNGNAVYNHLQNGGTVPSATWSSTSGLNITISAAALVNGLGQSFGNISYTGGVNTLTLGQSPTVKGNLTINSGTIDDGGNTITVNGNVANNGTHSGAGKIFLNGGAGVHAISGTTNTFGNLELDDVNGATFTGTGTTTLTGNLTATQGTLTLNAFTTALVINGTADVGIGATTAGIIMNSATGAKTFNGLINVGANGSWTNPANELITLRGGITNSGTFTAGTGVYTFDTNPQTLTGTISIPSISVTGVTLTNSNTLTVATALSGVGGVLTQASGAVLNIGGGSTISTLDASANPNTVNYTSGGAQTIKGTTYHHLNLSGAGAKTLGAAISVDGNMSVSGGTLQDAGFQITGNASGTLTIGAGTGMTLGTAASPTSFPTGFTAGNISLNNTSTVTYNSNGAQVVSGTPAYGNLTLSASAAVIKTASANVTVNGNLNIGVNNILDDNNFNIDVNGNLTVNGSHTGTGKIRTISGVLQTISGAGSLNNLEIAKTANNTSLSSAFTINGDLTVTSGGFTLNAQTLNTGGNINIASGSTFTVNNGAILRVADTKTITNAGTFNFTGVAGNPATITRNTSGKYTYVQTAASATFNANYFALDYGNLTISNGSVTSLNNGSFSNGAGFNEYINLDNFPTNINPATLLTFNAGPVYNIRKTTGLGIITLTGSSGVLAGEPFDQDNGDPGTLVNWTTGTIFYSQGTGLFSTLTNWDTNPAGGGTDPLAGDLTSGLATFIVQDGDFVTVNQNIDVYDLTIGEGTSGVLTIGNNATARIITVRNNLAVLSGGTINVGAFAAVHTLNLYKDLTINGTFDMFTAAGQVCNAVFTGAGSPDHAINGTPSAVQFNNITLAAGSNTTTAGYALDIEGNVVLSAASTFNGGGFIHTVAGGWTGNATASHISNDRIIFNGAAQTIAGPAGFYDLEFAGSGTKTINTGTITVGNDLSVTGNNLTITSNQVMDITGRYLVSGSSATITPSAAINITTNLEVSGTPFILGGAAVNTTSVGGNLLVTNNSVFTIGSAAVAKTINVSGNVQIDAGSSINVGNFAAVHVMSLAGNLIVDGNFDMFTAAGRVCNVTFTGATDNSVSGAGATCRFNQITVNKGAGQANLIDIQRVITMFPPAAAGNYLAITNGTFKLSSASVITPYYGTQVICTANGRLWLNNAGASIGSVLNQGTTGTVTGTLQVDAGTFSWGGQANSYIETGSATSTINISGAGAALNINGGLYLRTGAKFNMTAGSIVLDAQSAANYNPAFDIFNISANASNNISISGGSITIVDPHSAAGGGSAININTTTGTYNFSGSTFVLGNGVSSSPGSGDGFDLNLGLTVPIGSLTVDNPVLNAGTRFARLTSNSAISGDLITTGTGGSNFRLNNFTLNLSGDLVNNGTFTSSGGAGSILNLNGTAQQVISGTGTFTDGNPGRLFILTVNNSSGAIPGIDLQTPVIIGTTGSILNLTDGSLGASGTGALTLGIGAASTMTINRTNGSLVLSPVWNLTGVTCNINYNASAAPVTTGNELPSSIDGNINTLTVNNASGVLMNTGVITISGSLTLTTGIFNQQNNTINFITSNTPLIRTNGTLTTASGSILNFGTPAVMTGNTVTVPANYFTNNPAVIGSLSINKSVAGAGLTWNNQGLTINGSLTLNMNGGVFSIGANTLTFQNNDTPIIKTSGTITTAAGTSILFGTAGNTAGAVFTLPPTLFTAAPSISSLTVNRDNKLTWTNQLLTLSNTLNLISGEFDLNGQTFITNAAVPFARTTGTFTPGSASTLSFTANAAPFTIPDGFFTTSPTLITNLTLNRGAGVLVSLGNQELSVTGNTTLTAGTGGIIEIKNADMQIAAVAGTPSANSMIVTNGTGVLKRNFPSGASSFTFPVGDNTGTAEYSPAFVNFTSNATAGSLGVRVTDAKHPSNTQTDNYITRYWSFTAPVFTTYNYNTTFTYPSADVVGTDEANFKMHRYDNGASSWTADIGSNTVVGATSTLNTSSLSETSGKLDNNDFTSYSAADVYYWSRNTANWNGANAWVVTDNNVDPGAGGTPTIVPPSYSNSKGITIRNGHTITLNAGTYTADQMIVASGGILSMGANNLTFYNGTGSDLVVDGTVNTTGGQLIAAEAGIDYSINGILNTTDTDGLFIDASSSISTTNSPSVSLGINSTINFSGAAGQKVDSRLDYANLQITAAGAKTAQGVITVNANLTITTATFADNGNIITVKGSIANSGTHSGTGRILLTGGSGVHAISGGTSAFGNIELDDSNGATFTGTGTTNITGILTVTQGTLTLNAFSTALNVTGLTTVGNGGSPSSIIVNSATGTKTFTGLITIGANGTWNNIANGAITVQGGITSTGSFSAGTGLHSFSTNSQALNGTFVIPNITVTGITLTNNNILTVNTALAGTGALTQAANAELNLGFTGAVGITTLNADASGNTVRYNFAGAQTIKTPSVAYHNLLIGGSGTKTLAAATTVNRDLTISAGTLSVSTFVLQVKGDVLNNGTHTGTGSITLTGGTSTHDISGTGSYQNIVLNDANGASLGSNTTLNGVLTLTSGILKLGAFDLTLANTTSPFAGAPFSQTNMIETDGVGHLIRSANATNASFNLTYPVGSGGFYSPFSISGLVGAVAGARSLSVRAVPSNPGILTNRINKYWELTATNITTGAGMLLSFQYNAGEIVGDPLLFQPYTNTSGSWAIATGPSAPGSNPATSTGSATISGSWTVGSPSTYYSYQSGDWEDPDTWTFDPGGTTGPGTMVPGNNDRVVILSGRTVSLTIDNNNSGLDIRINNGGFLDQQSFRFTNNLSALRGDGTLKLSSSNFPAATVNSFVSTDGGTTEYNHNGNMSATQSVYYHLSVNSAGIVTQVSDVTLNGDLTVKQGTFQINDATAQRLKLIINGNVTVDNSASISVGTGGTNSQVSPLGITGITGSFLNYYELQSHRVQIYGNFTNNGTVRFSNLTFPVYDQLASNGFATVYFQGTNDRTLTCNGITEFYNLVVDKGSDQTFKLTLISSAYNNFRLFGANTADGNNTAPVVPAANPNLHKALWIKNGTLVLQGLVVIPSLSEGSTGGSYPSDFFIPANGALVLDGVGVIVLSTADDYREVNAAYGLAGGSDLAYGVNSNGGFCGISNLGKLQVNNGYLSTRESSGLNYWTYNLGQYIINNGKVDTKQFHNPQRGVNGLVSYTQNGGELVIRGRFKSSTAFASPADLRNATINTARGDNGIDTDAGIGAFSINNNAASGLTMSAGIISVHDVCNTSATALAFMVIPPSSNTNVSGGTVQILPTAGSGAADANYYINTTVPVYNMVVNRVSGTSEVLLNANPLTVQRNLSFTSASVNANNLDITIGGNFTIDAASTYTTGTNSTIFNGTSDQTFSVSTAAPLSLNKLTINTASGIGLFYSGTQSVINVNSDFRLVAGTLNDNGNTTNIAGNVYNSGTITGTGRIVLNGTGLQSIDGDGIYNNAELFNTNAAAAPVSLLADMTINGILTLSNDKIFNINSFNVTLNSSASILGASSTRYLRTSGNTGDGGLTKVFSSPAAFTFPVGVVNYTPGSIGLSAVPTTYGSITVVPVNFAHPNVTVPGRSLTYFWRVRSAGFTLGPATVTHGYTYAQTNVVTGADITEDEYVAARFFVPTSTWTKGVADDVDDVTNIIGEPGSGSFLENVTFIDGDYTAGDDNPTSPFGIPTIFYSRINGAGVGSGLWSDVNTWSLTGHTGAPGAAVPGSGDIVIIGGRDSVYLATDVSWPYTTPNVDPRSCSSLQIETGSALDIGFNPASVFGMVVSHPSGNGNFRLTTSSTDGSVFQFPAGDFSDFNINRGTTEFYSTNPAIGPIFILSPAVTSFGTVILSPLGGSNIALPNAANVLIYGDLICRGQTWESWLAMTWNGAYGAIVPKTVTVRGNLLLQGGTFIWAFNGATAQNIIIDGNVIVNPGAGIDVYSGTNNSMSIGGSLINNSDNSGPAIYGGFAGSNVRFVRVAGPAGVANVTFFGTTNGLITNNPAISANPNTTFNNVTVNKGSSQATTLTVDIGGVLATPADNWLTLQNGTLRFMRTDPGTDFTISQGTPFNIPATAGLYIDYSNASARNILIGNINNTSGDLLLSGKLTLVNGNVYVGPVISTASANDIEYSSSGASFIDVQGGLLEVNGQIRRNPLNAAGVLKYSQSSGTVTVRGQAANNTNAKLEVVNDGSEFTMSGGLLTIVRGNGATITPSSPFGDLYIRPQTGTVTGGTIEFAHIGINAPHNYFIDANTPLNNLTVTGLTAANFSALRILTSPLVLNGNMTINANSVLNTNNINVTFNGNLVNTPGVSGYVAGTNTTTFSASVGSTYVGAQSVTGQTNFYDLNVSPGVSLTINNPVDIDRNLNITSGTFIMGANPVTVQGNVANTGSYTDDNSLGSGLTLNGTSQQQISGTGAFARLTLNNAAGATIENNITVQEDLTMTLGILDIKKYLLTMGTGSNLQGAPFGATKMITSDGVFSNVGLRKFFNIIGAPTSFLYPIGTAGKYTPALLSITNSNTVGFIRINNISSRHPSVFDAANSLNYYWEVQSSGITGFTGDMVLTYMQSDVVGDEPNYRAARIAVPGTSWTLGGLVNDAANTIPNTFTLSNNLSGEYTAGITSAFFTSVPTYTTNSDGFWDDETIWNQTAGDPYPCPPDGPNGFILNINHVVRIQTHNCSAYRMTINGELRVEEPYYGHNFGTVYGNGTLHLERGTFPAGVFTSFLSCTGNATVDYGGTGTYTIIADLYDNIPNLKFTGTGTRVLPNKDLTICKVLTIDGPVVDNSVYNKKLTIQGSMQRLSGSFKSGTGAGATVSYAGLAAQTVGGAVMGDFTGASAFNNLEINNSSGLRINDGGAIDVTGNLLLTNGLINTGPGRVLTITNPAINCVIPSGGSAVSFVDGPLSKRISQYDSFLFPIGLFNGSINILGNRVSVSSTQTGPQDWTAQYHNPNTTSNNLENPLQGASAQEYFTVTTSAGSQAVVNLNWTVSTDVNPVTAGGISNIRVTKYNTGTSKWNEIATTSSGSSSNGTASTSSVFTFASGTDDFALGTITPLIPRAQFTPSGPVCGNDGIPVTFSAPGAIPFNYILSYTINGAAQPDEVIASTPFVLPTLVQGTYRLTSFKYNNGTQNGVVDNSSVSVYSTPTTAAAGLDQTLCGVSTTNLDGNAPGVGTGLWSVISGTGGTIITPTSPTSQFIGLNGSSYTLRWTISSGTCTSSDDVVINFTILPDAPAAASPQDLCGPSTIADLFASPPVGCTVDWYIAASGGSPLAGSFGLTDGNTYWAESNGGGGCLSLMRTPVTVNINPVPVPGLAGNNSVCVGSTGNVYSTEPGKTNYTWSLTGGFITSGLGTSSVTVTWNVAGPKTISVNYEDGGCSASFPTDYNVTVNDYPTITLGVNPSVCSGTTTANLTYSATTGSPNSYSIDYNGAAETAGFFDVTDIVLPASPLVLFVPGAAPAGTYFGTLTVKNSVSGCVSGSYMISVTVSPTNTVTAGVVTPICINTALPAGITHTTVGATGIANDGVAGANGLPAGVSATWAANVITISGTPTVAGSYNYSILLTGGCGAVNATGTINVTPTNTVSVTISADANPVCAGATVNFTATPTNGGTTPAYQWQLNGVNVGSNSITYSNNALVNGDKVKAIMTSDLTCTSGNPATSNEITMIVNPVLPVSVSIAADANPVCAGTTVNFTATPANGGLTPVYQWKVNGTNVGANSTTYSYIPVNGDVVNVILTSSETCQSGGPATSNSVTMNVSTTPTVTSSRVDVLCKAAATGSIDITVSGGSAPYTYAWTGNGVVVLAEDQSGLTAGTYSVIVSDAGSCTSMTYTFTITEPSVVLSGSITAQTNVSVFGGSNGSVTVAGSGGTGAYQYKLDAGSYQASGTFGTLVAGNYIVTVQDANLCTFDVSVTITQPLAPLSVTIASQTNVVCFGTSTGILTAAGSGGSTPYEYSLDGGAYQASGTFGSLAAGTYTITVRDAAAITATTTATVTEPSSALSGFVVSHTDILCFGGTTGILTVSGTGGTGTYLYRIGSGSYQASGTFTDLAAGTYNVTVQDGNLCTFNVTADITQPSAALAGTIMLQTNVSCNGGANGSINISGSGGTPPYEYNISGGAFQFSGTFSGLAAGSYTVIVRDAGLCTSNVPVTISEPAVLSVDHTTVPASCPNTPDGSISITISGGTQPYSAIWSDGLTGISRTNIPDGSYSVVVADANGCAASLDIELENTGSADCVIAQEIITPNNDGFNDTWKIRNIELFPDAEVLVYNRWGKLVFKTKNISDNEWDGTSDGKLLPTDSYHYILNLNDGSKSRSGVVSIIR